MARSIIPCLINGVRTPVDDTLPMTCMIESSQLVEGHGEYSIRVLRALHDPSGSWLVTRRFREFDDLNTILKEYGFDFELPKKKLLGRTDRTFMAERQKGLQIYLDTLVQQFELCNSLVVQRFLDPDNHTLNYPEIALQHVSMFIRSTNNIYQLVEQIPDLGWRYNKSYFLATKVGSGKDDRYLLSWCHYGLDKALGDKETNNCLKLLKNIAHPLIVPIDDIYANEIGTLTVYRLYPKGSLKDYLHQTKPTNGAYWKRYGRKTATRTCDLTQIKQFGRFILEALHFIYDNGLVYGHLHSGNILFDTDQALPIKLLDIVNAVTGVSSKYRCYISNLKQIRTLEQSDVYGFGRVLYELSTGEECPTSVSMQFPSVVPIPVQHILLKIFAPTGDLPTIQELLNDSFFQSTTSNNIERFQVKFSQKAKDAFEQIARTAQNRFEGDQTKIKNAQRRTILTNHLMSDEGKLRRRKEKQARALEQSIDSSSNLQGTSKTLQRSISVDPLQLSTERAIPRRPLTPNLSVDIPNSSQSPLAAPPTAAIKTATAAPPPPPPPPPFPGFGVTTAGSGGPPPPPPMMPGFGALPQLPQYLRKKQKYAVTEPVKKVQWSKINPHTIKKDSMWVHVDEEKYISDELFSDIRKNFASKVAPTRQPIHDLVDKSKELRVLDSKAAQNFAIMFSQLKAPPQIFREWMLSCDNDSLKDDFLKQLEKYLPTAEELKNLSEFKNEINDLQYSEQYFCAIGDIKRLKQRLKTLLFKSSYKETVEETDKALTEVRTACDHVRHSIRFQKLLELILTIGNYMNSSAKSYEPIHGFDISFLPKLHSTKANDGRRTLLHFIVQAIEDKHRDLLTFSDEFYSLADGVSKINILELQKQPKEINRELKNAREELAIAKNVDEQIEGDKFAEAIEEFITRADDDVARLEQLDGEMTQAYQDLCDFLAIDLKTYSLNEFFTDLKSFCSFFSTCLQEVRAWREQAARAAKTSNIQSSVEKRTLDIPDDSTVVNRRPLSRIEDLIDKRKTNRGLTPINTPTKRRSQS